MCDEIDIRLGRRLRQRRRLLGLSQRALGASLGVRFQQIQKYECAANKMSAAVLGRLAHSLGVGVGYFFEGLDGLMASEPARPLRLATSEGVRADDAGQSRMGLRHGVHDRGRLFGSGASGNGA